MTEELIKKRAADEAAAQEPYSRLDRIDKLNEDTIRTSKAAIRKSKATIYISIFSIVCNLIATLLWLLLLLHRLK